MSNPAVILNGDQVYVEELVRENARLTVQIEAERQHRQDLESALAQLKEENETLSSRASQAAENLSMVAAGQERERVLAAKLNRAIEDLHFVMAGGDVCRVCTVKCAFGNDACKPIWRGESPAETEEAADR